MEEDEETTHTRKSRRKRKPKKDSSPELDSPIDSEEESNNEITDKRGKKRGRKKKKNTPPESEEEPRDLDQVFGIVKQLMGTVNTSAFLERPDDTMCGMSDYYEVISKPMWLKEVERKYNGDEYSSATKLVADVRLLLENCYQYWGPNDTLSKRALKLEQAFESKLSTLPEHIQRDCSMLATHEGIIKQDPDGNSKKSNSKKGGYVSKLMNWVLSGRGRTEVVDDSQVKARQAERQAAEKQLTDWENENLISPLITEQINSMWEFPVIGQFLQLVHRVLNIDPISQLELERMLIMPQASKTLATFMTSMLIPPLFRAKLETGPAMPYSIWTKRLSIKVASWYRILRSKGDSTIEVFDSLGIEPQFWLVMGEENPLQDYQFHELTFLQRVWLLKALCDFLLHNHKTIQECINNLEMEDLREINLGKDKEGYSYHYFPIFMEVRIYKMAKWKSYEKGVENVISKCAEEEGGDENSQEQHLIGLGRKPLHRPPPSMRPSQSQFRLICASLEQMRSLIERLCGSDPQALQGAGLSGKLVKNLQRIMSELQGREEKMELAVFNVRARMREESRQFNSRAVDYIDPGLAYWKRKEREEKQVEEKREKIIDMGMPGSSTDGLHGDEKRERRSRRDLSLKLLENGLDDESGEESPMDFDDDSEDEWFANKKEKENHKKKKSMPAKKMKKLAEIPEKPSTSKDKNQDKLNDPKGVDLNKAKGAISLETPIKVKQELLDYPVDLGYPTMPSKQNVKQSNASPIVNRKLDKISATPPTVTVKQEITDDPNPHLMMQQSNVIQTLVPSVNMANIKQEKTKPVTMTPDLSKVKRSNSPQDEVVYISDSEDSPDVKPNPNLLAQRLNVNTAINLGQMLQGNPTHPVQAEPTLNYAMRVPSQPVGGSYVLANAGPNQGQYVPMNVAQPQIFNIAQQQVQPVAYPIPAAQTILQQPVNTNVVGMQASSTVNTNMVGMQANAPRQQLVQNPNQKFLVIQPNTSNNANQPNQFSNKGPKTQSFPTTPTTQNVNWGRGTQSNVNFSPRQRGSANISGIQGQSPRGRGSPRSPITPVRGQRFSGRTPPNSARTSTQLGIRTPTQLGIKTPSPMRGRGSPVTANRGASTGPVRSLNFNRSPAKLPVNDLPSTPDLEGTLVVGMTETGGFGYVIMLPDGGKISLSQAQLSKIRAENGGTLPKTCKVPLDDQL